MDELIETEATFLKSLVLLRDHVIRPYLKRCKQSGARCAPLEALATLASSVISKHSTLKGLKGQELLNQIKCILEDTETYVQYYVNADAFSYLIMNSPVVFTPEFTKSIVEKLEKANAADENNAKLDLSVLSLVQKPMSRIVKYQLLITSLSKANPDNTAVAECLQSVKDSLHRINSELETRSTKTEVDITSLVRFEDTIGKCPQFYGKLKYASVASLTWPKFGRDWYMSGKNWSMSNTAALLLFFESTLCICELKSRRRKRRAPLLVIPYDSCQFLSHSDEYDGGLTNKHESSVKLRFVRKNCEYEAVLGFINTDIKEETLSHVPVMGTKRKRYGGIECYLPETLAPSDICIRAKDVNKKKYKQCYFRKVLEHDAKDSLEKYLSKKSGKVLESVLAR
ncbi:hypothetical protein FT663_03141 [Candidozyma haemuli var. vulneris]|uniref:DH domain-containing protein n=1 Tax=Candidozyma haemuli TaxID=45357 RepID=A0A2V1B0X7_9ASCO|nr:hypothetical protein CXQ85_003986 [[Candida] haemuloni]KAF3987036.1 hypothetical protein FT662_04213 [[Candida] haemuloni var. vulneris]KAF3990476.1 hypothetical protein FT663_03141 [[Candida] haemuloni var. vulneris]PVH23694.1 hypothetical protein CXQ85_003986 [[Candida] haemuloni]